MMMTRCKNKAELVDIISTNLNQGKSTIIVKNKYYNYMTIETKWEHLYSKAYVIINKYDFKIDESQCKSNIASIITRKFRRN